MVIVSRYPQNCFKKSYSKKAETNSYLIGNKIPNKITPKLPQKISETVENETNIPKERYISK